MEMEMEMEMEMVVEMVVVMMMMMRRRRRRRRRIRTHLVCFPTMIQQNHEEEPLQEVLDRCSTLGDRLDMLREALFSQVCPPPPPLSISSDIEKELLENKLQTFNKTFKEFKELHQSSLQPVSSLATMQEKFELALRERNESIKLVEVRGEEQEKGGGGREVGSTRLTTGV